LWVCLVVWLWVEVVDAWWFLGCGREEVCGREMRDGCRCANVEDTRARKRFALEAKRTVSEEVTCDTIF
jgi:hypothetical protein